MKYLALLFAASLALLWAGCAGAGQDVDSTPVGSVLSGETKDADGYLNRVEQQNAANTRDASVNQTQYQSHEHTNFGTAQDRY